MESSCDEILVLEEGYPLVEEMVKNIFGKGKRILGRLDGTIPRTGELNPDIVLHALGRKKKVPYAVPEVVKSRPPALCPGCGHQDLFVALKEVLEPLSDGHVFSDIGCYPLEKESRGNGPDYQGRNGIHRGFCYYCPQEMHTKIVA